jgi:hypothetical protein
LKWILADHQSMETSSKATGHRLSPPIPGLLDPLTQGLYTMSRSIIPACACVLLVFVCSQISESCAAERSGLAVAARAKQQEAPQLSVTVNKSLMAKVRRVLDDYYSRPLNTRDDPPWSVLHWGIAYGIDAQVAVAGPRGQQVTAIGWLCSNYRTGGKQLIRCTDEGFSLPVAPGVQGHDAQFLSMLAQACVPEDYPLRVGDEPRTVAALVDHEQQTCEVGSEQTFKLIGISHYRGTQVSWENEHGEPWSIERLLREELKAPVSSREATCGGSHRVFAMNYAAELRSRETAELTGVWLEAAKRAKYYQNRAFKLQNADGSFSTAWFDKPENREDEERHLICSGHILEYLAFSLPEEQLRDPRFERGVLYVAQLLERSRGTRLHRGGMGHALHGLAIYEQRVLGTQPGDRISRLAQAKADRQATATSMN